MNLRRQVLQVLLRLSRSIPVRGPVARREIFYIFCLHLREIYPLTKRPPAGTLCPRYTVPKTHRYSMQLLMTLSLTHNRWYYVYSYGIRDRIAVGSA